MRNNESDLDVLDAIADAAARAEEDHGKPTPESRAAAHRYQSLIAEKLGEMRRLELARHDERIEHQSIPEWLLAMSRSALEATVAAMRQERPSFGVAYRNLTEVTDDDLRTMIQDAHWAMEQKP